MTNLITNTRNNKRNPPKPPTGKYEAKLTECDNPSSMRRTKFMGIIKFATCLSSSTRSRLKFDRTQFAI